jgi:parallel beta helix pectate lyase-like protein
MSVGATLVAGSGRRAVVAGAVALLVVGSGIALGLGAVNFLFGHDNSSMFVDRASLGGRCDDGRSPGEVSKSKPWCSLRRAVAATPAGSTVLVRAGSYGRIKILKQKRASQVVVKAYPGEKVNLPGGFRIQRSSNFRIDGFRINSPTFPSSVIQSSHIEIANNDASPQGLQIQAVKDSLIEGNYIHDVPRLNPKPVFPQGGTDGNGITANGYWDGGPQDDIVNLTIRNNVIRNTTRDGLQLGGGEKRVKNVLVEGNEFDDIRRANDVDHPDGIQMIGGDQIRIRGNFFHDSEDAMFISDDWTRNLVIENNLMVGGYGGGIQLQMKMTPGARVINNTIWNSGYNALRFAPQSGDPTGLVLENNIIDKLESDDPAWFAEADYNLIASGPLRGAHSIRARPTFTNPAVRRDGYFRNPIVGNYQLAPGSPGIDAGTSTDVPAKDRRGVDRFDDPATPDKGAGTKSYYDMGTYEFSRAHPSPGGN